MAFDNLGNKLVTVIIERLAKADSQETFANFVDTIRLRKVTNFVHGISYPEAIGNPAMIKAGLYPSLGVTVHPALSEDGQGKRVHPDEAERTA